MSNALQATGGSTLKSLVGGGFGSVGDVVADPQFATNRPSGLTNVMDRQWASVDNTIMAAFDEVTIDSEGMTWADGAPAWASPAVAATPASYGIALPPDSSSEVLRVRYLPLYERGVTPFQGYVKGGLASPNSEYYHAAYIYWPSAFDMASNNLKWLWNGQGGSPSTNHLFMAAAGPKGGYVGPWMALQGAASANLGGDNRSTIMGPVVVQDYVQGSNPDNGYWDSQADRWTMVEWYSKEETTPGVSTDGVFKAWSDGVLVCHYDEVQYSMSGGFRSLTFAPYYGGGGETQGPNANQDLFVGRFLVAVA